MHSNGRALLAIFLVAPLLADLNSIRGLIRGGRLAEAIAECDRELKAAPRSSPLYTMKGLALRESGDKVASLTALRQALAFQPAYEPALQAAAQIEFENRDANASQSLELVLRLSPASEAAHAMLAVLMFERRSCEGAVVHFEKAPKSLESPSLKWQYGVCLLERQRWAAAAKQFTALLQLREHGPARYNLALAYWNAQEYRSVVSTLLPMEAIDPDAQRLLASAYAAAGEIPQALAVLRQAIQKHPREEQLLIDLAVLCLDQQAWLDLGIDVMRFGLRATPSSAKLETLLGVLLVRRGDVASGEEAFRRAQALAPESGLGRIGLASILMQLGRAADAERMLREQLATHGADPRTELTLVRALLLKGPSPDEQREAAARLQRILKLDAGHALAHGLLGKVYVQMGDLPQAMTELAHAIRLDPADRTSTYQLMTIYRRAGRMAEAAKLTRRVASMLDEEKASEFRVMREANIPTIQR